MIGDPVKGAVREHAPLSGRDRTGRHRTSTASLASAGRGYGSTPTGRTGALRAHGPHPEVGLSVQRRSARPARAARSPASPSAGGPGSADRAPSMPATATATPPGALVRPPGRRRCHWKESPTGIWPVTEPASRLRCVSRKPEETERNAQALRRFLLGWVILPGWGVRGAGQLDGPSVASGGRVPVVVGAGRPGQDVAGRARMRARTSSSRWWPGGRRRVRAPAWRTRRAGTRISRWRRVAIMAWPSRTPWPSSSPSGAGVAVSWCSQPAMVAREQRAPHPRAVDLRISGGEVAQRGAVLGVAEDVLDAGAVPVPVLHRGRPVRGGHVEVGHDERVGVDRGGGAGELGQRQGALVGVQGAPAPGPRVGARPARRSTSRRTRRISSRVAAGHQSGQ